MKIWAIDYECTGFGRHGTIYLTADVVQVICRDFHRFWLGRQEVDKGVPGDPFFGDLVFVRVRPWAPWTVDADGQLASAQIEARGGLEWKIDGSGAGFTFIAYAEGVL